MKTRTLTRRFWRLWRSLFHRPSSRRKPTSFGDLPPDEASRRALDEARQDRTQRHESLEDFRRHLESL